MKRFDILRTITFLILAYGIFTGNSCFKTTNTEADSKCGDSDVWKHTFNILSYHDDGVTAGIRQFHYELLSTPENICSEEHVQVNYIVNVQDSVKKAVDSLSIRGNAYWSLYGRSTPLEFKTTGGVITYEGGDEIGLKQAFPSGPGYIGLQIIATFPTRGDALTDATYLQSKIKDLFISCSYRLAL